MFSYCENNPINTVDYLGHNPLAIFAGVGAAIASALSAAVTAMVALTVTAVAVHTIDQVAEKIKEKVKTTQDTSPRDQSVYILTNKGGDVRYVGRTNNPPRRMAEHERDKNHPERINYKMTVVFSGLTDKQAVLTEQILISAFTLEHLDNARREISAGRIAAFKAEVSSVAELLGGFAEDEIMNLGRRR